MSSGRTHKMFDRRAAGRVFAVSICGFSVVSATANKRLDTASVAEQK